MRSKKTIIGIITMFTLAFIVVIFGAQSFAKYVYNFNDHLEGHYVDFRITVEGDAQTAVMYERKDTTTYKYEGIIPLKVANEKDGEISKREIEYEMITPSVDELKNGKIYDAWGDEYPILPDTRYYDVGICDELGNAIDTSKPAIKNELLTLPAESLKEVKLNLSIKRLKQSKIDPTDNKDLADKTENISLVLRTIRPYKSIRIINIKVANSLVIIDPNEFEYFKFNDLEVDIKTSKQYIFGIKDQSYTSLHPSKIVLTLNGSIIFDKQRFIESLVNSDPNTTDSLVELTSEPEYSKAGYKIETNKITLYLQPASSIRLSFYIDKADKSSSITANCYFKNDTLNNEHEYTNSVAGIIKGKVY